jgi:hypothetical protein
VDCVKPIVSTNEKKEFIVMASTKTEQGELKEINITSYVKTIIDEILTITSEFRRFCSNSLERILFIYKRQGMNSVSSLKQDDFTNFICRVCKKQKVDYKTSKGIRNYYMQVASEYMSDNGKDISLIPYVTGHSPNVHAHSYDKIDMIKFCEFYYNVGIGDVYLTGTITEDGIFAKESRVAEGCGFCGEKHCIILGKIECMECDYYRTTISCIPYYESEIAAIDEKLKVEKISYEKDLLLCKKKLHVGYLSKLMEFKLKLETRCESEYE